LLNFRDFKLSYPYPILHPFSTFSARDFLVSEARFLAASTECSAGSNDHFVGGGGGAIITLVQFDGRPLGGANFKY
jgi:hypothetical protein